MSESIWIMVVWFAFGSGLNSYDAGRGGAAPIGDIRYETKQKCEAAATAVREGNKHMSSFRVAAVECMAITRPLAAK